MIGNKYTDFDKYCAMLFQVSRKFNLRLPPDLPLIYLGGLIERMQDDKYSKVVGDWAVESVPELELLRSKCFARQKPVSELYVAAKYTADSQTNKLAEGFGGEQGLAAYAYFVAKECCDWNQLETEASVFKHMVIGLEDHLTLLSKFYECASVSWPFSLPDFEEMYFFINKRRKDQAHPLMEVNTSRMTN